MSYYVQVVRISARRLSEYFVGSCMIPKGMIEITFYQLLAHVEALRGEAPGRRREIHDILECGKS